MTVAAVITEKTKLPLSLIITIVVALSGGVAAFVRLDMRAHTVETSVQSVAKDSGKASDKLEEHSLRLQRLEDRDAQFLELYRRLDDTLQRVERKLERRERHR